MPKNTYLDRLNPAQRSAVEHGVIGHGANIAGPLLAIAGAGSGKTDVLAYRAAHLVVYGVDPRRVLLLTFTNKAAQEMTQRAGEVLRKANAATGTNGRVEFQWAGTFHAIGARLLRMFAKDRKSVV